MMKPLISRAIRQQGSVRTNTNKPPKDSWMDFAPTPSCSLPMPNALRVSLASMTLVRVPVIVSSCVPTNCRQALNITVALRQWSTVKRRSRLIKIISWPLLSMLLRKRPVSTLTENLIPQEPIISRNLISWWKTPQIPATILAVRSGGIAV